MKRAALLLLLLSACRGKASSDAPIHVFGDMDWQPKYGPQEANPTFSDGRAMRALVEGTVAQGHLDEDDSRYRGREGRAFVARAPLPVDEKLLRRGQERFDIYCAPCHDKTGSGQGLIVKRGYPPPIDLAAERVRTMPDGEIFDVITHGSRNMPSYRKQIPTDDRWAIVTWVRVLGRSQHASVADVPADQRGRIDSESGTP